MNKGIILRLLVLVLFLGLCHVNLFAQTISFSAIATHIKQDLKTRINGQNKYIIKSIYAQRGYRPLWAGAKSSQKVNHLMEALDNPLFNYKQKSFDRASIHRLFYLLDNAEISPKKQAAAYARLDLLLSNSMLRLVRFVAQGDVDWKLVQSKLAALEENDDIRAQWEMKTKPFPKQKQIVAAIKNNRIIPYLNTLIPMKKRYKQLIGLLKKYRTMPKPESTDYSSKELALGDNSSRVKALKRRLQISGDYPKNASIDRTFDSLLEKAVLRYQKRYLLQETGRLNKKMAYYLNQPLTKNIQSIITNLDKTKLYPKRFKAEHIEVNIPDFNLRYYKGGELLMKKGLIVGRIDRPTPLFHNSIRYMVLNPTWTITDNLVKKDLIPTLRTNPLYLEENDIHAFRGNKEIKVTSEMLDPYEDSDKRVPYRFVQSPGENNALGKVKFMFPNKYAVYLHDTDNKALFDRRYKIYSSGCMRVEEPFELMNVLLKHSKRRYSTQKIDKILEGNRPISISLKRFIPVHILYFTAYEEEGFAYFRNDIYLYDRIIEESI
ncbi:MAG: murein L,D-transpeptidase, partial [Epsilonproteobacteria bacterium]